jgi:hypothetical protein
MLITVLKPLAENHLASQDGLSVGRRRRGHRKDEAHDDVTAAAPLQIHVLPLSIDWEHRRRRGHCSLETHCADAAAAPPLDSNTPGYVARRRRRRGQYLHEAQDWVIVAASLSPTSDELIGGRCRRGHRRRDAQCCLAAAALSLHSSTLDHLTESTRRRGQYGIEAQSPVAAAASSLFRVASGQISTGLVGSLRRRGHGSSDTHAGASAAARLSYSNALDQTVEGRHQRGHEGNEIHFGASAAMPLSDSSGHGTSETPKLISARSAAAATSRVKSNTKLPRRRIYFSPSVKEYPNGRLKALGDQVASSVRQ